MVFCLGEFGTCLYALVIEDALLDNLGTTCLHSKIVLCKSNFGLPRVAVLGYKVAGIARQQYVIYLTFSA